MTGACDLRLVALSVVVAAIASYAALDLAGRVSTSKGKASAAWLPNRILLEDRLTHLKHHADRCSKPFGVMFIDLDRFKPVNDCFGHGVGDQLLRAAVGRPAGCVRKEDTVARCRRG